MLATKMKNGAGKSGRARRGGDKRLSARTQASRFSTRICAAHI